MNLKSRWRVSNRSPKEKKKPHHAASQILNITPNTFVIGVNSSNNSPNVSLMLAINWVSRNRTSIGQAIQIVLRSLEFFSPLYQDLHNQHTAKKATRDTSEHKADAPRRNESSLRPLRPQTDNTKTRLHVMETAKTTRPMSTRYRVICKNFGGPRCQLNRREARHSGRNKQKATAAPTTSSAPTTSKQTTGIGATAPCATKRHPRTGKPKKKKPQMNGQQEDARSAPGPLNGMVSKKKNTRDNILQIYTLQPVFTRQPNCVNK